MIIPEPVSEQALIEFQETKNLIIPHDLTEYFLTLNGLREKYDENFFCFNSFDQFETVEAILKDWKSPDYRNLVNTLPEHQQCFIIADNMFHLFTYAIKLYPATSEKNEVYILFGDEYKIVANSFTEFIALYLEDPDQLQL